MALAEISVANNQIVVEVGGAALLAPLVSAAAGHAAASESARDAAEGFKDEAEAAAASSAAFETEMRADVVEYVATSDNLYDPSTRVEGSYIVTGTGAVAATAGWAYGSASVVGLSNITISAAGARQPEIWFYDEAGDPISGSGGSTGTRTLAVPSGAVTVKFNVKSTITAEPADIMVNEGETALAYEAWSAPVLKVRDAATPPAIAAFKADLEADVLTTISSVNLYNPAQRVEGSYVASSGGAILSASGWARSGYMPVEEGEAYTVSTNATRQSEIGFYEADLTPISSSTGSTGTRTVTAPTAAAFMVITVKSTIVAEPSEIMVNAGSVALEYVAWTADRIGILASAVAPEAADPDAPYAVLMLGGVGAQSYVESNRSGHVIRNTFTPFPTLTLTGYPCQFNIEDQYLDEVLIRSAADDIAPDQIASWDVGANHGYWLGTATAAAHGKVTADEGSIWTTGGVEYVLVRVDSSGVLSLAHRTANTTPLTGTYTHVSGATNTASFSVSAVTGKQWYPPFSDYSMTVWVDGVVTDAQVGAFTFERDVMFAETRNILPRADIIDWWIANGGASAGLPPVGDPNLVTGTVYHFDCDGQMMVFSNWLAVKSQAMSAGFLRGLQVGLAGSPLLYQIPGGESFTYNGSPINFGSGVDPSVITSAAIAINIGQSSSLQATGEYGNRMNMLWSDYVYATGFLPLESAAYTTRRSLTANKAANINTIGKYYFRVLDIGTHTMAAGSRYAVAGFRHVVPRAADGSWVTPVRPPGPTSYLHADFLDVAGTKFIDVPADMVGRPYTVEAARNAGLTAGATGILPKSLPVTLTASGNHAAVVLRVG